MPQLLRECRLSPLTTDPQFIPPNVLVVDLVALDLQSVERGIHVEMFQSTLVPQAILMR